MKLSQLLAPTLVVAAGAMAAYAWASRLGGPVGNSAVPQPAKPVDLQKYLGAWFEIGRYENGFERDCEGVTAVYRLRDDGLIDVTNTCRQGAVKGPKKIVAGRAKLVAGSEGAKLKVSFFGPFFVGDYWVLDHADDYAWSIVGEPSGRFLWLLSRSANPTAATRKAIDQRVEELGYDASLVRPTLQPPSRAKPRSAAAVSRRRQPRSPVTRSRPAKMRGQPPPMPL